MRGITIKPAEVVYFVVEDRIRLAVVKCPYCSDFHRYVVPEGIVSNAPLLRSAKCDMRRGLVRLVLPLVVSS